MRREKGWLAMRINRVDMLRYNMHLLIVLLLIRISPSLVCPKVGLGGHSPRVSIVFLLGRKNVCMVHERGLNDWPLHFWWTNWVDDVERGLLVHGFVAGIGARVSIVGQIGIVGEIGVVRES